MYAREDGEIEGRRGEQRILRRSASDLGKRSLGSGECLTRYTVMVNPKQRHVHRVPRKKQQNRGCPDTVPPDEEDWMVVKKQKITILIPPLPGKVPSTMPSVGQGQLQETPRETKAQTPKKLTSEVQIPHAVSASNQTAHAKAETISLSPEEPPVHPTIVLPPSDPNLTFGKPSSPCRRIASDNSPLSLRNSRSIGMCSASKGNKGIMLFADGGTFLSQRMRACHLEKKLIRAGGLENWLVSLGLTCFVKIFQRQRMGKFQLVNLTMEKLKDMGTNAVGPRRKLMHAIDCICEPHCFQQL